MRAIRSSNYCPFRAVITGFGFSCGGQPRRTFGPVDKGFNRLMEAVIHYSRIALARGRRQGSLAGDKHLDLGHQPPGRLR